MEIIIRELVEDDMHKGFLETLSTLSKTEISEEEAKHLIPTRKSQNIVTLVALPSETPDRIIGTAALMIEQKFSHSGGRVGHIEDVSVLQEFQGNGIGRKLVNELIRIAKEHKCYKVVLTDTKGNKDFYESVGMFVDGLSFRLNLE